MHMFVYSDVLELPWIMFRAGINMLHTIMHILFQDTTIQQWSK